MRNIASTILSARKELLRDVKLNKGVVFNITKVTVRPESIPAGISLCDELKPSHSVLIIDLGGTTLDISMVAGQMTSVSRIYGDPKLGVSLVTDAVKLALARRIPTPPAITSTR